MIGMLYHALSKARLPTASLRVLLLVGLGSLRMEKVPFNICPERKPNKRRL